MNLTYDDLSDDQKSVHDKVISNIQNKKHTTITGGPGVGKTTLIKFIFSTLKSMGVSGLVLTAPTHQAKNVLAEAVGMDASTIHSALKISPVTNEELRVFEQIKGKKGVDLSECRIFVVEEVSMVDKELFRIIKRTVPSHCVILGLGDIDQLWPVNNPDGEPSPFFDEEIFDVLRLDKVMRQAEGNPIITVSREIRDGKPLRPMSNGELGVFQHEDVRSFLIDYFKRVKTPEDFKNIRMFGYTNDTVDKLNAIIRKHIYKTEEPFVVDEIIVMQEPLVQEQNIGGQKFTEIIYNNNEWIRVLDIIPRKETLRAVQCNDTIEIEYLLLKTESVSEETTAEIKVIVDPKHREKLQDFLNYVAGTYKRIKQETNGKAPWYSFWEIKNKFQLVKALPVCTYHKGQGSTYDHSYMYTRDAAAFADYETCKRLFYVGTTRARYSVHYV